MRIVTILFITIFSTLFLHLNFTHPAYAQEPTAHNVKFVNQFGGQLSNLETQGDYAYVAEGIQISVFNISDPTNPTRIGHTAPLVDGIQAFKVSGNYLYLVNRTGLQIFDITKPGTLTLVGDYPTPEVALDVGVVDNYAVIGYRNTLEIVNVSDPNQPTFVSNLYQLGLSQLEVSGDYVYTHGTDGHVEYSALAVVDISDPTNPVEVAQLLDNVTRRMMVEGNQLYTLDSNHFVIYDVTTPASITVTSVYTFPNAYLAESFTVDQNKVYIATIPYSAVGTDNDRGIYTLDISTPTAPTQLDFWLATEDFYELDMVSNYVYALANGFHVLDASNLANFNQIVSYPVLTNNIIDSAIVNGQLYLADDDTLHIITVDSPTTTTTALGSYPQVADIVALQVVGTQAYIQLSTAVTTSTIAIWDVTDPANASQAGRYVGLDPNQFVIANNRLYIANDSGLTIVDVSNPASPQEIGYYQTTAETRAVHVVGDTAYITVYNEGLSILNVADPTNIQHLGWAAVGSGYFPSNIIVNGNMLYIGGRFDSIYLLDISNPATPVTLGTYNTSTLDLALRSNHLFVRTEAAEDLQVLDISNPASPALTAYYNLATIDETISVADTYIYMGDRLGNVYVLQLNFTPPAPANALLIGPSSTLIGSPTPYQVRVWPADVSLPLTVTWQTDEQTILHTNVNTLTDTALLTWQNPGNKTITVIVNNATGRLTLTKHIQINLVPPLVVSPTLGGVLPHTTCTVVCIVIPADAVTQTTEFHYTPVFTIPPQPTGLMGSGSMGGTLDPALGWYFGNIAFYIDAYRDGIRLADFTFEDPLTITLNYTDADISGLNESALDLRYWDGTAWQNDGIELVSHNTQLNQIVFTVNHLTQFALIGQKPSGYQILLPLVKKAAKPDTAFGADFSFMLKDNEVLENDTQLAKEMGAGWVRYWVPWSRVEVSEGVYDWAQTDTVINGLHAKGLNVLVVVYGWPEWVGGLNCGPMEDTAALEVFIADLTARYGRYVDAWEFTNEPDGQEGIERQWGPIIGCWSAYPAEYAAQLEIFYNSIKAGDPGAPVLFGGLAYDNFPDFDRDFLENVLQHGGGDYFDALSVHYYPLSYATLTDKTDELKETMLRNNVFGKQIWVTETSTWTNEGSSLQQQQNFIAHNFTRGLCNGVNKFFWFAISHEPEKREPRLYRWLINRQHQPDQAYYTFQHYAQQVNGLTCVDEYENVPENAKAYQFAGSGRTMYILWSNTAFPQTILLPIDQPATITSRDGDSVTTLQPKKGMLHIEVGVDPVFVEIN